MAPNTTSDTKAPQMIIEATATLPRSMSVLRRTTRRIGGIVNNATRRNNSPGMGWKNVTKKVNRSNTAPPIQEIAVEILDLPFSVPQDLQYISSNPGY
jgi:hypothetical protein